MFVCQYGNCENQATTKGTILALNPGGGKDLLVEVYACDKHKKNSSFFESEDEKSE